MHAHARSVSFLRALPTPLFLSLAGGGVGTNQPDTVDVWKVYSANGTHGASPVAPHQQLFDTTYTDSQGTVYDGHSGW